MNNEKALLQRIKQGDEQAFRLIYKKMIKCYLIKKKIKDYIDGILPSMQMEEMKTHLSNCRSCSVFFEEFNTVQDTISKRYEEIKKAINQPQAEEIFGQKYEAGIIQNINQCKPKRCLWLYFSPPWRFRRLATEAIMTALVISGLLTYIFNSGLGYSFQTYIYLLKYAW